MRCTSQDVTTQRQPGGSDKCLPLEVLPRGQDGSAQAAEVWCGLMAFASPTGLRAEPGLSSIQAASDACEGHCIFWC